jgi:hypothetical protein
MVVPVSMIVCRSSTAYARDPPQASAIIKLAHAKECAPEFHKVIDLCPDARSGPIIVVIEALRGALAAQRRAQGWNVPNNLRCCDV